MQTIASADFTATPTQVSGMTLSTDEAVYRDNHSILGNSQQVVAQFQMDASSLAQTVQVTLVGLVSRLNPNEGYSPVTISCNGQPFVINFTVPGGGYGPNTSTFQVPAGLLRPGGNSVALQVAADAKSYFWLYRLGVELSAMPFQGDTLKAALNTVPPNVSPGMTVLRNDGQSQSDHFRYANNQGFAVDFNLKPGDRVGIALTGLVSRLGPSDGYSPVDLLVNGTALIAHFTVPGGGWGANTCNFLVPPKLLHDGQNVVEVRVNGDARSMFWLYSLAVTKNPYQQLDTVNLSVSPPVPAGFAVVQNEGWFAGNHFTYDRGGQLALEFSNTTSLPLIIKVNGLVSRNGPQDGYSPISMIINGQTFVSNYTMPGGGWDFADSLFSVPSELLKQGANHLVLQVSMEAQTHFWLRNVSLVAALG